MGRSNKILQNIRFPKGNNWKAVVLSILAAAIFWLFQSLNKNYSTNLNYPITFDFPAEEYVIMDKLPDEVQINISGIGWNIFRKTFSFGLNPIRIHLETPAATRKMMGTALLANINDQLPQFQVNYVISDTLYLNIEPKTSRTFRVYIDSLTIDLKNNYRITSVINTDPDSVSISGPQSIIKQLPANLPLRINEQKIDESLDEAIRFEIRGYQQSLIEVTPEDIDVQFNVEEFVSISDQVEIADLDEFEENIYVIDSTVNVTYTILKSNEGTINRDEILVFALPQTLNKEDSTVQLYIKNYPEQILSISLDSTSTFLKVIYE